MKLAVNGVTEGIAELSDILLYFKSQLPGCFRLLDLILKMKLCVSFSGCVVKNPLGFEHLLPWQLIPCGIKLCVGDFGFLFKLFKALADRFIRDVCTGG